MKLKSTAPAEQMQTRPVADLPALAALWMLSAVVVAVVAILREWPAGTALRVWLYAVLASASFMAVAPAVSVVVFVLTAIRPGPTEQPDPNEIRLVAVNSDRKLLTTGASGDISVHERDLRAFVRTICDTRDWSLRSWLGKRLPSGKTVDQKYHGGLMKKVLLAGIVMDYGPRKRGLLAVEDAADALRRLNLH